MSGEHTTVIGRVAVVVIAAGFLAAGCSVKSIDSDLSERIEACRGSEPCIRRTISEHRCFEWADTNSEDPSECLRAVREGAQ